MTAPFRIIRLAISVTLAVSLVPLPIGQRVSSASAATTPTPYTSIFAFPDPQRATYSPSAVAIAPTTGTVFVVDSADDMVRAYAADGTRLASWGGPGSGSGKMSAPTALAVGPTDGLVYVADTGNNRVQVFTPDGTYVRQWGSAGAGDGQFNSPRGIAVGGPDNAVFVTEIGNYRVQKFSTSGVFQLKWGAQGDTPDTFQGPEGVAVDAAGLVYVVDRNKFTIKKFSISASTATWLTQWGWNTSTPSTSRYNVPRGMTLAPSGDKLVIADTGNFRVEVCDLLGTQLESFGVGAASSALGRFNGATGAALAADGTLYVADTDNHRVQRATAARSWTTLAPWATASSDAGMLSGPLGVSASSTGTVYVADTGNSRVLRYSADGTYAGALATSGTADGQVSAPSGVKVAPDGSIYVADTGNNRIQRFSAAGAFEAVIGAGMLTGPTGLALVGSGELLVADTGNGTVSRVARFTLPTGAYLGEYGSYGSGAGQLKNPTGLDVAGTTLWIADTGNNRVQRIDTGTGTFGTAIGSLGTASGKFYAPRAVLGDGAGGVIVADTGNDRLQTFSAAGVFSQAVGAPGAILGRFHAPAGLASAPGGRTLVVERDGCRVQVFVRDVTPPTTTISGVPAGPVSTDVTLTLSAIDSGDAGMGTTYYQIDGVSRVYTAPITLTQEATVTVAYWSVDRAGATEAVRTSQVVIDRTPPAGGFVAGGGSAFATSRTVGVVSAVSGAAQMRAGYGAVVGTWGPYAETTQVVLPDADGPYDIAMGYRDLAGNELTPASRAITLDRTLPSIANLASPTHPLGVPTYGAVRVTWDAASDPSGIAGYRYSLDHTAVLGGSAVLASTSPSPGVDLGEIAAGDWYFHVRATDGAGNAGPIQTLPFSVIDDTAAPRTTITGVPSGPDRSEAVTVSLEATDALSGVVSTRIAIDGAEKEYASAERITKEGTTTIEYWSVDRAGNVESHNATDVVLDRIAPTGSFAGAPSIVTTRNVEVSSAVIGAPYDMRVAVGGVFGAWAPYAPSAQVILPDSDGVYLLEAEYRDRAGNVVSLQAPGSTTMDRFAPPVTGLMSSTHVPGVPTYGQVRLSWDIPTDLTGLAFYRYSLDSAPLSLSAAPLGSISTTNALGPLSLEQGTYFVHVQAVDVAGNRGLVAEERIDVLGDSIAPHTVISGVPGGPVQSQGVTLSLEASDTMSGVSTTYVRVNGAQFEYAEPFRITAEGANLVDYWSVDASGNVEATNTATVVLDRTGPDMVGLRSPTHSATSARPGLPVVAWDPSGDLSGVAGYVWSLDRSPSSTPDGVVSLTVAPGGLVVPADSEGAWFLHVRAVDAVGNRGPVAHLELRVAKSGFALSRPVVSAKSKARKNRTFYVRGSMNSGLSNGQVSVRAYQWRRSGRRYKWVLRSAKYAAIGATSASSAAYRGTLKLSAGRWKVIVVHPDDGYTPAASSSYSRTFTVR